MLASLYNWFWKAEYWIPPGFSWTDLEDSDGVTYPHSKDLWIALPLTFVLVLVRYCFERTIGLSLSRAMGVRDKLRVKAAPNPILESFFWTQSQNPKEEPWFWEPRLCWEKYPKHPLQPAIYWWFLLEIVFYLSLLLTLFFDVKRKDFKEQIIHHFVAITLIFCSYSANFLRIGALVLLLHDVSDVLLEAGKMFNYAKWKYSCDITFLVFALVFFVSRLIFFPTKVIYTTYHYSRLYFQLYFGFYFFNGLLMILQILHIFWFSLICRMLFQFILARGVQNDIRSDMEDLGTSDDQSKKGKQRNEKFQTHAPSPKPGVLGNLGYGGWQGMSQKHSLDQPGASDCLPDK
ncbi:ceramide synthase 4-like isoform X2 [Phascolarctos cinereus]|uniref:Ceramide synthase 4-like isoform X2 n=1 Tax=Phascolarctos cinereus TaxID=38626 RepID=A0A6P5JS27_PHACI|nr:ceramide synthase 4-like isoform X2 [Phascolarctos cinereus]